ncbi:MAG: threonine dehydratase [Proteobacteria bacterium]|nr:threonine dehydratase [Pseudomonadota bacterium]
MAGERGEPPFTLADIKEALAIVREAVPATPQYAWPLLRQRTGIETIVKHENHTPTGAFKVRGGLVYVERLRRARPDISGLVTATRGNHGQSLAFACARAGIARVIVVPHGNSAEKNAAMRALGAELIEHGADFDAAREHAVALAAERGLAYAPSLHRDLILGVATYAWELFDARPDLATVYVPIGLGTGICGVIGTRDALGLATRIVGVVAAGANAYRVSADAGRCIATNVARTFADGMAVRVPDAHALAVIRNGCERIVEVTDDEIAEAIRVLFSDTHTLAEGAGAAALAALMQRREHAGTGPAAVVVSGQNIDRGLMQTVLAGATPPPG